MTVRLRDCAPVPHDLVQVDQAPNADTAQCTGHGPWLHRCVSAVLGHAAPPLDGCVCVRVRRCVPAPHDLVHWLHAPYVPSTQSTGHACWLQARVSAECGHTAPPALGCVTLRLRDWKPPPLGKFGKSPGAGTIDSSSLRGVRATPCTPRMGPGMLDHDAGSEPVMSLLPRCGFPFSILVMLDHDAGTGPVMKLLLRPMRRMSVMLDHDAGSGPVMELRSR